MRRERGGEKDRKSGRESGGVAEKAAGRGKACEEGGNTGSPASAASAALLASLPQPPQSSDWKELQLERGGGGRKAASQLQRLMDRCLAWAELETFQEDESGEGYGWGNK